MNRRGLRIVHCSTAHKIFAWKVMMALSKKIRIAFSVAATFLILPMCVAQDTGEKAAFVPQFRIKGVPGTGVDGIPTQMEFVVESRYRFAPQEFENTELNRLSMVLHSDLFRTQLEITDQQLDQFNRLFVDARTMAGQFGTFTYEDFDRSDFREAYQSFVNRMQSQMTDGIQHALLPHQLKLADAFAERIAAKNQPVMDVLGSQRVMDLLQLSPGQVSQLQTKSEEIDRIHRKRFCEIRAKYRTELMSVLPSSARAEIRQMLADEFIRGCEAKAIPIARTSNGLGISVASMDGVGRIRVYAEKINPKMPIESWHPYSLISIEEICREIELSPDQRQAIEPIPSRLEKKFGENEDRTASEQNPAKVAASKNSLQLRIRNESIEQLEEVLTAAQKRKLTARYYEGIISNSSFIEFLISKTLSSQLPIDEETRRRLIQKEQELQEDYEAALDALQQKTRAEIVSVLGDEQRRKIAAFFGDD